MTYENKPLIDPRFEVAGWGIIPHDPNQSDLQRAIALLQAQADEIIRLSEENERMKAKLRSLGQGV